MASTKRDRTKLGTILVVAERRSIRQAHQTEANSLCVFGSGVSCIVCDCVLLFREKQKTSDFHALMISVGYHRLSTVFAAQRHTPPMVSMSGRHVCTFSRPLAM